MAPVMNENGTGGTSPGSTANRPSRTHVSKSMLSRSSRGGVPVFNRPHSKPNALTDSASSHDGGSPTRPPGVCSTPTCISPRKKVPVVITSARHA